MLQLKAMTKRPDMRVLLLFLLTISSDFLHTVADETAQNQSTTSPLHGGGVVTTSWSRTPTTKEPSVGNTTTLHSSKNASNLQPERNGTSGDTLPVTGTEKAETKRQLQSTESPPSTQPPVSNATVGLAHQTEHMIPTSAGSSNTSVQNSTQSGIALVTTQVARTTQGGSTAPNVTNQPVVPQTVGKTSTTSTTTTSSTTTTTKAKHHTCTTAAPIREGMVSRCLIIIAVLAALATTFIVTTIVLATKLAGSRYRNEARLLQETEMVCISSCMNDTDYPLPKPHHPKSNGALISNMEDEDGDDLTLNSFLPETDGGA